MRLSNYIFPSLSTITPRINSNQLVALFIMGFVLIYSIVPCLWFQTVLPDSAQNLTWGHKWLLSYDRHPPLGTWLITSMHMLFHNNEIAAFSSNVICFSVSLWFIYKLSQRYLDSQNAIVACIFTSFSLFYLTNYALQFNQNTIMLPFWVLTCYFFDNCLRDNRFQDWILLAIVAAASLLAKYESLLIIMLLFIYLLWHFEYKFVAKLIMAFIVSSVLIAPHFISVAHHGFLTFKFIFDKIDASQTNNFLYIHLYYPIFALFEQLSHILPAVLLLLGFVKYKYVMEESHNKKEPKFNYLIYIGIAPLGLVVLISLLLGLKITAEWGFPLFSFTLPAIISYFNLKPRSFFLRPLVFIALAIHLLTLFIYLSFHYFSGYMSRTNYPSYALANAATQYWHQFTNKPLKYIGGDEYIDYYLAAYLPTQPLLLEARSLKHSPWLNKVELKKDGIMLVIKGCEEAKILRLAKQFSATHHKCITVPLSHKYRQQFSELTLMVALPTA